jgi:hypothetical protein
MRLDQSKGDEELPSEGYTVKIQTILDQIDLGSISLVEF